MLNLLGAEFEDFAHWLAVEDAHVHLYGKANVRPGRKMDDVTRIFPDRA